jgi:hypothetical protein
MCVEIKLRTILSKRTTFKTIYKTILDYGMLNLYKFDIS